MGLLLVNTVGASVTCAGSNIVGAGEVSLELNLNGTSVGYSDGNAVARLVTNIFGTVEGFVDGIKVGLSVGCLVDNLVGAGETCWDRNLVGASVR